MNEQTSARTDDWGIPEIQRGFDLLIGRNRTCQSKADQQMRLKSRKKELSEVKGKPTQNANKNAVGLTAHFERVERSSARVSKIRTALMSSVQHFRAGGN